MDATCQRVTDLYSRSQASLPDRPVASGATGAHDQINDLSVDVGKAILVDTPHMIERIAVGTSDIAEATAISPTEIMINGKAVGETSLILWQQGGGRQFFNVQIRPSSFATNDKLDGVRRELSAELPRQTVRSARRTVRSFCEAR